MKEDLPHLRGSFLQEIEAVGSLGELEDLRVKYLGRKGLLTSFLKTIKKLPIDERPKAGAEANQLKEEIDSLIARRRSALQSDSDLERFRREKIDVTLPGKKRSLGRFHPITQVIEESIDIFVGLGFTVELGPEIESDYYHFEALNMPPEHPARDMWSTFYVADNLVLRAHTSPVQIRVMQKTSPPVRIISVGRCYRRDPFDPSHSPVLHQIEGLYVDECVSFADLKGTLEVFVRRMYGEDLRIRFVPSYFPFTEPSAELKISCVICGGKGCKVCKQAGWLEVLGCGMVHPAVFRAVGYDPKKYTGFAFGMGVDRIAMLKYRIDDIRLFYENDLSFLEQF
jgi:phenylalanyl-tRNA synthetase alpha chain